MRDGRSHRLRSAERRRRRRRRIGYALGLVGLLSLPVLLVGGLLVRDALALREQLTLARSELVGARAAAANGDLDLLGAALIAAEFRVRPEVVRTEAWHWRLAARVPVLGEPVALTRSVVTTAAAGVDVGLAALEASGPEVLTDLAIPVADGQVDLAALRAAGAILDAVPVAPLVAARGELAGASTRLAPDELVRARDEVLRLADEGLAVVATARDVLDVTAALLGADGTRRHLLVLQTPAELRGTGGLLGATTVLTADAGRMTLSPVLAFEPADEDRAEDGSAGAGADGGAGEPPAIGDPSLLTAPAGRPVATSAAFAERYDHTRARERLSNVNVDPDLATSAALLLGHAELRTGARLDGVILMDPVGLGALLQALRIELVVPAELRVGTDLPERVAGVDLASFAMIDVYDDLGIGREDERGRLVAALGEQAFTALFATDWDAPRMLRAITAAASGRHLQVHSVRPEEAAVLTRLPVGGDLAGFLGRDDLDAIAVTANNAVGGKQDVHLAHRHLVRVALGVPGVVAAGPAGPVRPAARLTTLATTVVNPLVPGAFDPYVTGNCLVGLGRQACFEGDEADNRTWWSVWLPAGDRVGPIEGPAGPIAAARGTFHGANVVDPYLEVASATSGTFRLSSAGEVGLTVSGDRLVHRIGWWRQAKAVPDVLDLTVLAPPGWRVAEARLVGGIGRLALLGPDADVAPIALEVGADRVRAFGAVGGDLVVEVAFEPAS